jgi:hypothetical protein
MKSQVFLPSLHLLALLLLTPGCTQRNNATTTTTTPPGDSASAGTSASGGSSSTGGAGASLAGTAGATPHAGSAGVPPSTGGAGGSVAGSGGAVAGSGGAVAGSGGSPAGGAGGNGGAAAAAGKTPSPACPTGLPGPSLVLVPASDGSLFCIDATPVTQGQYAAFLQKTNASTDGQTGECVGQSHVPVKQGSAPVGLDCKDVLYNPTVTPSAPMGCARWCDAKAYCSWAGKRLCGAIGGGAQDYSMEDQKKNMSKGGELYEACSQNGKTIYPYGNELTGDCQPAQTADGVPTVKSVMSLAGCHGTTKPFDQVWDMVGTVYMWSNQCGSYLDNQGKQHTVCTSRGGVTVLDNKNFNSEARCDQITGGGQAYSFSFNGIRCCADAM